MSDFIYLRSIENGPAPTGSQCQYCIDCAEQRTPASIMVQGEPTCEQCVDLRCIECELCYTIVDADDTDALGDFEAACWQCRHSARGEP